MLPRIHLADGPIFQRDMSPHSFVDFAVDVKWALGGAVAQLRRFVSEGSYQGIASAMPQRAATEAALAAGEGSAGSRESRIETVKAFAPAGR